MQITIAKNMESLQKAVLAQAREGKRIALVPTMGALHEGHLALVRTAREYADTVVLSIFVNPRQFGVNEDFGSYPRQIEEDVKKAELAGASIVYTPSMEDMYPPGYLTTVSVGELGEILCGAYRPGHFDGVATVVTKLILRCMPHLAIFGEKDYQQLCVIRRAVYDLDIPVEIFGMETVREADGLAMSSRNAYLTAEERAIAPKLHETLVLISATIGMVSVAKALEDGIAKLTALGFKVDYLELRQEGSLNPIVDKPEGPARLLVAAWLGKTRLIDNILIGQ